MRWFFSFLFLPLYRRAAKNPAARAQNTGYEDIVTIKNNYTYDAVSGKEE
jgi:hypothetical protein